MIQTSVQTTTRFYPAPPINRMAARQTLGGTLLDGETKSRIYNRLLELLSNPRISVKKTGLVLPSVLHPLTRQALADEHEFTATDIAELETQIIRDVDESSPVFEVLRDAPAALYHALEETGESDSIIENRIVPLPSAAENALLCGQLQREFSRRALLACDGFIEQRDRAESGIVYKVIRLDIGGWIVRRGFMLPVYRNNLITALRIFRHPADEKPFRLKSRITEENL